MLHVSWTAYLQQVLKWHFYNMFKWHLSQLCIAFAASIKVAFATTLHRICSMYSSDIFIMYSVTFATCIQSHLQQLCIAFDSRPKHFKWLHLVQCQFIKPTQNTTTPNYSNVNLLQRLIPTSSRSHDLLIVYTALSCLGHKYKQNQKKT